MEVLAIAAELAPYTDASQAGRAAQSLTKAVKLNGHEVTLVLPRHRAFESGGLLVARRLTPLELPDGRTAAVYDGQLPSGVKLMLLECDDLFDREGPFGDDDGPFADNAERYGAFGLAVAELIRQRADQGQPFDVVHGFDWPGALAIAHIRAAELPGRTVLTVVDARNTGTFLVRDASALGFKKDGALAKAAKLGKGLNVLKLGVEVADRVTTVSDAYAEELCDESASGKIAEAFAKRGDAVSGILCGLDHSVYNPATDSALASRYDAEDRAPKAINKGRMLRSSGLELEIERPLIVFVGPLTRDRGADVLAAALPGLLKNDVAVLIVGRGDDAIVEKLQAQCDRHPDHCALLEDDDPALVRRAVGAADMLLSPARHEPGAEAELVAFRYGAVPIALAVGGVVDVVVDCDPELETGTGFLFTEANRRELLSAAGRALAAYKRPDWHRLVHRIMRRDLGWERPARRYGSIYRALTNQSSSPGY